MRERFCKMCGGWHQPENWPADCWPDTADNRSTLAGPMIIGDSMPPAQHPCNGAVLDSKSAFRAVTKAHGCIEVGNEKPKPKERVRPDRKAVRKSVEMALSKAGLGA